MQAPEGKIDTGENRAWWEPVPLSGLERLRLNQALKTLRWVREQIAEVEKELGRLSTHERWAKQAVHLLQLPGVGSLVTMTVLAALGEIQRFPSARQLVGDAGFGAGVAESGEKHYEKGITQSGRTELRWAVVAAAWQAIRSNARLRAEYDQLCQPKPPHQAIVAMARKRLVILWCLLNRPESYHPATDEELAYQRLTWAGQLDKSAWRGMTHPQFAREGLIQLGQGEHLTKIVKGGRPRRIAPKEEVLARMPELSLQPYRSLTFVDVRPN